MWSYYGSKTKLVDLYPPPKTDKIIEPFCGSAKYSLKYWNKQVLLMDKYSVVVELWKWLQKQSRNEILDLPNMEKGDDLRLLDLPKEAKYLIGFCINRGSIAPKNIASGFNNWNEDKIKIADNVFKIKHWEIVQGSYEDLPLHTTPYNRSCVELKQ
jgi:site-specific DNA-adenine methylase